MAPDTDTPRVHEKPNPLLTQSHEADDVVEPLDLKLVLCIV